MTNIKLFESKKIRSFWDEETEKWYFAIVDVVEALTDSVKPRDYWYRLKKREKAKSGVELSTICRQFKLKAANNRMYDTDCGDIEATLRIIQSIPSPKAEPFKRWLAEVGRERLEEIENPELAVERMRELYRAKGYDEEWIDKRMQSIAIRNELTDEWQQRGVKPGRDFGILTAVISRETFNISPKQHKEIKLLKRENLRDHMTPLELVLTMLGEASTTEIARNEDAQGFQENKEAAKQGGQVAGSARRDIEARTGRPVVSSQNYLPRKKGKALPEPEDDVPF